MDQEAANDILTTGTGVSLLSLLHIPLDSARYRFTGLYEVLELVQFAL